MIGGSEVKLILAAAVLLTSCADKYQDARDARREEWEKYTLKSTIRAQENCLSRGKSIIRSWDGRMVDCK